MVTSMRLPGLANKQRAVKQLKGTGRCASIPIVQTFL